MRKDADDLSAVGQPQPIQFERRVVLGSVLAVSVASLLPIDPRRAARAATPAKAVLPAELLTTLDAFADRIIPADENGPGARAAGAATYIDRSLGDWNAGELAALSAGLRAIDAFARSRFATNFTALSDAQKDELLTAMEAGQAEGFADAQSSSIVSGSHDRRDLQRSAPRRQSQLHRLGSHRLSRRRAGEHTRDAATGRAAAATARLRVRREPRWPLSCARPMSW